MSASTNKDGPQPTDSGANTNPTAPGQGGPGEARPVLNPMGSYQPQDERGQYIPQPVYQLVPCIPCLVHRVGELAHSWAHSGVECYAPLSESCEGTKFVRRDPEKHPIAPKPGVQEKK